VTILRETKRRILVELKAKRLHGYDLAKRLNIPITGIYQHLRDLADVGLIVSQNEGRRRVYSLTKKGQALLMILEQNDK